METSVRSMGMFARLDGPLFIREGSIVVSTLAILIFVVGAISWVRYRRAEDREDPTGAGDDSSFE